MTNPFPVPDPDLIQAVRALLQLPLERLMMEYAARSDEDCRRVAAHWVETMMDAPRPKGALQYPHLLLGALTLTWLALLPAEASDGQTADWVMDKVNRWTVLLYPEMFTGPVN